MTTDFFPLRHFAILFSLGKTVILAVIQQKHIFLSKLVWHLSTRKNRLSVRPVFIEIFFFPRTEKQMLGSVERTAKSKKTRLFFWTKRRNQDRKVVLSCENVSLCSQVFRG